MKSLRIPLVDSTVALLTVLLLAVPAGADTLRVRNLPELVAAADRIFIGTCLGGAPGSLDSPGIGTVGYTEYRFLVEEWLKSPRGAGSGLTLRHLRPLHRRLLASRLNPGGLESPGLSAPAYEPGERYLIFLLPDDELGLTSAAGSIQGVFRISRAPDGRQFAANGIDNLGLFRGARTTARSSALQPGSQAGTGLDRGRGPLELERLVAITRMALQDPPAPGR